jgi:hypothetical protein
MHPSNVTQSEATVSMKLNKFIPLREQCMSIFLPFAAPRLARFSRNVTEKNKVAGL